MPTRAIDEEQDMWVAMAGLVIILITAIMISLGVTRLLLGGFFKLIAKNNRHTY